MNLICLDFETFYSDEYTLKKMTTAEYVFDPRFKALGVSLKVHGKPAVYTSRVNETLQMYKAGLEDAAIIAHHAHFDGLILAHHYGIRPRFWFCTLSMARALGLQADVGGSLAALCAHFGLGEKTFLSPDATPEQLRARAIQDAELTYQLFGLLVKGFPADELKLIDWTVRCFTEPMLQLNADRCGDLIQSLVARKQKVLDDLGIDKKQLGSNVVLAGMLKALGVEPPMKPSPSDPTQLIYAFAKTDQAMRDLAECGDPEVEALVSARIDLKSTGDQARAERLMALWTAARKLPVYLNYAGAHTHRWSGGDKTNFQNLSKKRKDAKGEVVEGTGEIRQSIEAPEGHVLVVGDASQVECRITMWLAGETEALNAFRRGDDLYSDMASDIYGFKVDRKHKAVIDGVETFPYYVHGFVGKTAVLGNGFGQGWLTFKDTVRKLGRIEIEEKTARKAVDTYREKFYGVPKLWRTMERLLGDAGATCGPVVSEGDAILLPNGMKLYYNGLSRSGDDKWTVKARKSDKRIGIWGGTVTENVVQALARILIADQLLRLNTLYPVKTMTHDELVMVVPEAEAEYAKGVMQSVMALPLPWCLDLPLACEVGFAKVYGGAK